MLFNQMISKMNQCIKKEKAYYTITPKGYCMCLLLQKHNFLA